LPNAPLIASRMLTTFSFKTLSAIICMSFNMGWTPWLSQILMEFLCSHIWKMFKQFAST
jgi:hypothetical protein